VVIAAASAHRSEAFAACREAIERIKVDVPIWKREVATDGEAWVVNHLSDSIAVVDLDRMVVTRTLHTDDEPCDVVFARGRAFVSCSQADTLLVFDLADLDAAPATVPIGAEDPRALAVSEDGVIVLQMPHADRLIAPIVYTVPLQLLAYHVAVLRGTDVDQPRNLAKSVTVE